jgi:Ras-related C3 botulinum toxin substrate 1
VGDGAVGKTSFLISFAMEAFPQEYVPTTFDNFNAVYPFEGIEIFLGLWDTAGQADFDKLRPISYRNSDVYLLFYSVVNTTSLENIKERWVDEVTHHSPNAPYFLVGTQIDERENPIVLNDLKQRGKNFLTHEDGVQAAKDIGAIGYFEISAKQMQFSHLFDDVIRYVINIHRGFKKKKSKCVGELDAELKSKEKGFLYHL